MRWLTALFLLSLPALAAQSTAPAQLVLAARTSPWLPGEKAIAMRVLRQGTSYRMELERRGEPTQQIEIPVATYHYLRNSLMAVGLSAEARRRPAVECKAAFSAELTDLAQTASVCTGDLRLYLQARALLVSWVNP